MAEELKACPFCGGKAHATPEDKKIRMAERVMCLGCAVELDGPGAIDQWNTRAQLPGQGGEAVGYVMTDAEYLRTDGRGGRVLWFGELTPGAKLYTHPADQVAELRAMLARVVDAEFGFGHWPSEAELRQLLAKSEGVKA
jgi:hypothetical protein